MALRLASCLRSWAKCGGQLVIGMHSVVGASRHGLQASRVYVSKTSSCSFTESVLVSTFPFGGAGRLRDTLESSDLGAPRASPYLQTTASAADPSRSLRCWDVLIRRKRRRRRRRRRTSGHLVFMLPGHVEKSLPGK